METAKILIVEDEVIFALDLKSKLNSFGYIVTSVVNSGEAAVREASQNHPDLILMDIRIEGSLDGIQTAEIIREKYDIPVVFVTAYLDKERIDQAKITMPFGYILKPVMDRELKVTIEMALHMGKIDRERKVIERQLIQSEEKYRGILETMAEGYMEHDLEGNFVFFNSAATKIFGYTSEELNGAGYKTITNTETSQALFQVFRAVYKNNSSGKLFDHQFVRKNGEIVFLEASISLRKDENGKAIGFRTVFMDITEKRRAEQLLQMSEEKNRLVIENTDNEISIVDEDGVFLLLNTAAAKQLNGLPGAFIGKTYWDVYPKEFADERQQERLEIIKSGKSINEKIEFPFKSGLRCLSLTAVPCKIGEKNAILSIHAEVTNRKKTKKNAH